MYPDPIKWDDENEAEAERPLIEPQYPSPRPLREFFVTIVQASVIALFIIYFVAQASVIHGLSMEPNLHTDERVIVEKISYHFVKPKRGDVVVVDVPDSEIPLIKRVIALPGEVIEIRRNQVFINGQALDEPYLGNVRQVDYGPIQVPDDSVFVMGDNRSVSRDSRAFGPVTLDQIWGRAWISYWPAADAGLIH